jgi:hypothetical protein
VIIDTKLGREDHGLIPRNCDRKGAGTTLPQLILEPNSTGGENKKIKNSKRPEIEL